MLRRDRAKRRFPWGMRRFFHFCPHSFSMRLFSLLKQFPLWMVKMPQNKYDDPEFFARYSAMPRSVEGLDAAGEWPVLRSLLPDLQGKRVLDLGCGFGWHCRYVKEQGASHVVGVDLSEKMLERAQEINTDQIIEYRRASIEDVEFTPKSFDLVLSSLAFHYVERLEYVFTNIFTWLTPGGAFVFSVEHPVFTAREAQDWHYGPAGERLHWPVDNYQSEGIRHARWMTDDIVKYHRSFSTLVQSVLKAGFRLTQVAEPQPPPDLLAGRPDLRDESRRPMFLILATEKVS